MTDPAEVLKSNIEELEKALSLEIERHESEKAREKARHDAEAQSIKDELSRCKKALKAYEGGKGKSRPRKDRQVFEASGEDGQADEDPTQEEPDEGRLETSGDHGQPAEQPTGEEVLEEEEHREVFLS